MKLKIMNKIAVIDILLPASALNDRWRTNRNQLIDFINPCSFAYSFAYHYYFYYH